MMTIGSPVPDWSSPAYLNDGEVVVTSKEQLGRWYVLYWYPLDFTFICPTEIRGFQTLIERFENINVSVIGASTDSFHSHKAWFADRRYLSGCRHASGSGRHEPCSITAV